MSDVVKNLTAARDLISDPRRWTQGEFARNAKGGAATSSDPAAVCWCSLGAVRKITNLRHSEETTILKSAAKKLYDGKYPAEVNDLMGHDCALSMFDCAISIAKAQS